MTVTEFGYCQHCDTKDVELVMTVTGNLSCHKCGAIDIYASKEAYQEKQNV